MEQIIFICTGNTCRSPMAEGLFHAHNGEEKTGLTALLPEDISDPFGGDLATYRRSAAEIDKGVQAVIKNLSR